MFIAPHDDFEEFFRVVVFEAFKSQVVKDQQVGFKEPGEEAFALAGCGGLHDVGNKVVDLEVKRRIAGMDSAEGDSVHEVRLARSRLSDGDNIFMFSDKSGGGKFADDLFGCFWIERPVEVVEAFQGI